MGRKKRQIAADIFSPEGGTVEGLGSIDVFLGGEGDRPSPPPDPARYSLAHFTEDELRDLYRALYGRTD